ncbi:hypothetical protein HS7_06610 [Sulfolobales archaeon HS-7]|nr:hypothetical protein HS7_06610 [Sulfolobales archaeon HS-7]
MTENSLKETAEAIIEFEKGVNKILSSLPDDSKSIIEKALQGNKLFQDELNKLLSNIEEIVKREEQREIEQIRKQYDTEKGKQLQELKTKAEKNFKEALNYVVELIEEVYK